jgi:hypothetical protein
MRDATAGTMFSVLTPGGVSPALPSKKLGTFPQSFLTSLSRFTSSAFLLPFFQRRSLGIKIFANLPATFRSANIFLVL